MYGVYGSFLCERFCLFVVCLFCLFLQKIKRVEINNQILNFILFDVFIAPS